jgi:hypothetical protein
MKMLSGGHNMTGHIKSGAVNLFATAAIILISFSLCFATERTSVTSSGETLYYVGTAAPSIGVAQSGLSFGTLVVGSSLTLSLTVTNNGAGDLLIGSVTSLYAPFSITADTCSGQTIKGGTTCNISVDFAPASPGAFSSNITIPSNDPVNPNLDVTVTGNANAALISVAPNPVDFGSVSVGSSSDESLIIKNSGNFALTLAGISTLSPPFSESGGTCTNGTTLLPGQSCTLTLSFTPTSPESFDATLTIISNAVNVPVLTVTLVGTSTAWPQKDVHN